LDDPRGNLTLAYLALLRRARAKWMVWENVPGVLSIDGGRVFGAFLWGLGQLGYGFAYRVLDAQHFGVPQRRRRVFVVGYLGDWRRAAAVLFEPESLQGNSPPSRGEGQRVAGTVTARADRRRGCGIEHGDIVADTLTYNYGKNGGASGGKDSMPRNLIASSLNAGMRLDPSSEEFVVHSLCGEGHDASEDGSGHGVPLLPIAINLRGREGGAMPECDDVASIRSSDGGSSRSYVAFQSKQSSTSRAPSHDGIAPTLDQAKAGGAAILFQTRGSNISAGDSVAGTIGENANRASGSAPMVAVAINGRHEGRLGDAAGTLSSGGADSVSQFNGVLTDAVRRFTPRECERLMGLPDDHTLVRYRSKPAKDGPRYRAIGNSMAVPVLAWIGRRIDFVDAIT
jgi:DNA (cytosine-5)-methyltransferase 1